jgi:hypothetical protein
LEQHLIRLGLNPGELLKSRAEIQDEMLEHDRIITQPMIDRLTEWLEKDHTIKNPVRDGQEKCSIMHDPAAEQKASETANEISTGIKTGMLFDSSASERRMKKLFDMKEDSALIDRAAAEVIDKMIADIDDGTEMAVLAGINTGTLVMEDGKVIPTKELYRQSMDDEALTIGVTPFGVSPVDGSVAKELGEAQRVFSDRKATGIEQKKDNWPEFAEKLKQLWPEFIEEFQGLVKNQFSHGGDKYKGSGKDKEFTDLICEAFPGESGIDWVLGTCMKYMGRYKNFGREKDLLKVGCYMFILWLKGDFYGKSEHDEDIFVK